MLRKFHLPGINPRLMYADRVEFYPGSQSYKVIDAVQESILDSIDVFGAPGEAMTTAHAEFLEWFRNAPKIPKTVVYGKPYAADWGHAQGWALEDVETVPNWIESTHVQAVGAVIRSAVIAIDDSSFGWQKKARLFGVVEGAARRAGVGRVLADSGSLASPSVRSIRSLIAAGRAEDRGTLGPEPK